MSTGKLYDLQKKSMIILLFETGMRISELLTLKIGSIKRDFGDYILEFEQKGGAIHRVVLNELALSYLGNFLEELAISGSEPTEEKILFQTRSAHKPPNSRSDSNFLNFMDRDKLEIHHNTT